MRKFQREGKLSDYGESNNKKNLIHKKNTKKEYFRNKLHIKYS